METTQLVRQFKWEKEILNDPNPSWHVNKVVEYFTDNGYPQMLNAMAKYDKETETAVIYSIGLKTSSLG